MENKKRKPTITDRLINEGIVLNLRGISEKTIENNFDANTTKEIVTSINKARDIESSKAKKAIAAFIVGTIGIGLTLVLYSISKAGCIVSLAATGLSAALGLKQLYDYRTAEIYDDEASDYLIKKTQNKRYKIYLFFVILIMVMI